MNTTERKIEVAYGYFDDTRNRKWVAYVDGEILRYVDGFGHGRVRTFGSEQAARNAAEREA